MSIDSEILDDILIDGVNDGVNDGLDDDAVQGEVHFRTCPLCEAGCGLQVEVSDAKVTRIRGDRLDVFSHGYICPKGSTLKQLHEDPDRLRKPLVKRDGRHVEVSWAEAYAEVERLLMGAINTHGREAVGIYVGNPTAHNLSASMYVRTLINAIGTKHRFSASTVDQMPKHVASGYLFGSPVTVPVPDLDRTDYLLMLGADPHESNGSLCTAPDFPGRMAAIRDRGGRIVAVDPRRSKTAQHCDEWIGIRPGTDAMFLLGVVNTLFVEGLVDLGSVADFTNGLAEMESVSAEFTPEAVAGHIGIEAETIRRIARELAGAPTAAVYGRVGASMQRFGTLSNWLVDVVNILTGNLDQPGGAMFSKPAAGNATTHGQVRVGSGFKTGRGFTRVRGLPEVMGEYPVAAMAEEIATPGAGQLKAMVMVAGNPVLSTPDGATLSKALDTLEAMICVDIYLNETTRHADVILPAPSPLQKSHYDVLLSQFNVRNVANYSPPVLALDQDQPDEWEVLATLASIAQGFGAGTDPHVVNEMSVTALLSNAVRSETSIVHGRDVEELRGELQHHVGVERQLDVMLRTGPYGDGFGARPDGLTLSVLQANPHGIDLGPLQPRMPDILRTPSGMIELTPPALLDDLDRLRAALLDPIDPNQMMMIGRRQLRSNNSWMHNINVLVKGKQRCTLVVNRDDAERLGLVHGGSASVGSATNSIVAVVEVSDDIRPGVVSLPHGWGHGVEGTQMSVAAGRAGVNSNLLAGTTMADIDVPSGTSVLNGIRVTVSPVTPVTV
jgi:anaerobic selenocysteine-containing dehydrogenase